MASIIRTQAQNYEFLIKAAKEFGYTVSNLPSYETRQDNLTPLVLFAGTIDECLSFVKQEIVKHDNWKSEPSPPQFKS